MCAVTQEASRPAAGGCDDADRKAGARALRRGELEEAGRPCRARGWKALCPSSLLGREWRRSATADLRPACYVGGTRRSTTICAGARRRLREAACCVAFHCDEADV